jgi:RNA polymerase sigma factor (sigma-70 family)
MTKRTNEQWIRDLHSSGLVLESALSDLRAAILRGLPSALFNWLSPDDPHLESLAEEVVQETLVRVLEKIDTFEGRSQFTTWVYKISVRIALTELRHRKWKDVSLESLVEKDQEGMEPARPDLMRDANPDPEASLERQDMMDHVQVMIKEELTEKQRTAMMAVSIRGLPLEEVARQMGMERNALYKLLHDARFRLKQRLAKEGLSPQDLLKVFQ